MEKKALVIFYKVDYENKKISEIERTPVMPKYDALEIYANTRCEASELFEGHNNQEIENRIQEFNNRMKSDKEYVDHFFDCL